MARVLKLTLAAITLAAITFLLWDVIRLKAAYDASQTGTERYFALQASAQQLHLASEQLTFYAKEYAQTLNRIHAEHYLTEAFDRRSRETALKILYDKKSPPPVGSEYLRKAMELSDALAKKEMYALRLVAESANHNLRELSQLSKNVRLTSADAALSNSGKLARARDLLFHTTYDAEQREIMAAIHKFIETGSQNVLTQERNVHKEIYELLQWGVWATATALASFLLFCLMLVKKRIFPAGTEEDDVRETPAI